MVAATGLSSGLYEGVVSHCRFHPRRHRFAYRVYMVYLDLSELEQVFGQSCLWSLDRFNAVTFSRRDYLGDPGESIDSAVRSEVFRQIGRRPAGRICMLTNLRHFGFIINPITTYYCFDVDGALDAVVAEVTNTPWRQRTAYVIDHGTHSPGKPGDVHQFAKAMHVSPFMPMDMSYHWRSGRPGSRISLYMENHRAGARQFSASMHLKRHELSPASMRAIVWRHPMMSLKVAAGIYWQAMKLWMKGVPFYPNPRKKGVQNMKQEESVENHLG